MISITGTNITVNECCSSLLRAKAYTSVAVAIPNSANSALVFDTNYYDNGAIHATPGSRFVVPAGQGGVWQAWGECVFAGQSPTPTGVRAYTVAINGNINNGDTGTLLNAGTTNFLAISIATVLVLNAGDYVEFIPFQASGGPLNVLAGSFGGLVRLGS